MPTYLLDSNTVSDLYGQSDNTLSILARIIDVGKTSGKAHVSILTHYEAAYGVANASEEMKPELKNRYDKITKALSPYPVPSLGAETFGKIKAELIKVRKLNKNGAKKHSTDIILAVTAIENDCILVSADNIYKNIQEIDSRLKWEDWTKS